MSGPDADRWSGRPQRVAEGGVVKNRFLWVGVSISLALHMTFLVMALRVEVDLRDVVRKVKLRMVEEAAERKKEKAAENRIRAEEEAKKKAALEAKKKAEQKKEEKKIPPKVEPKKEEPKKEEPKKEEPKKEEPKKEEKPEIKPPEKPQEPRPPEAVKPKVRKDRKKQKTDKVEKKKVEEKKAEEKKAEEKKAEEPPKEAPPGDGKKKGVPIDLAYAMDGTSTGGTGTGGGSGVPVVAGDGMDLPDDGDDGEEAGGPEGPADDGEFVDQDELYGEEDGLAPEDDGGTGGGSPGERAGKGVGGGGDRKSARKARVKTVAAHKVSRSAAVSKGVDVPYPEEVKGLEIQGRVHLELTVDEKGKVVDVRLKKGLHPVMDNASMEAAWKLEFTPALKEGEPVAVKIPYVFTFVLE